LTIVNLAARRRVRAIETAMELQVVAAERGQHDLASMAYDICRLLDGPPEQPIAVAPITPIRRLDAIGAKSNAA